MEWSGVSLLVADLTLPSRPCLAKEGFFLGPPPGWLWSDFISSLTNIEPYKSVFLSLGYLESSDWAIGPTYTYIWAAWPFTPTPPNFGGIKKKKKKGLVLQGMKQSDFKQIN